MRTNNPSLAHVKAMLTSRDPKVRELVKQAGADLVGLSQKSLGKSDVHNDGTLSNISVQFRNESFIGLSLLPVVQVPNDGKYFIYGRRDRLATPDDAVGVRSKPNEVSESRTTGTVATNGYALEDFIDANVLRKADSPLNEMVDLTVGLNDRIDFREEKRIAAIMTSTSLLTQNTTLSGANQWNSAGGGDPITDITTAVDAIWSGSGSTKKVMYSGIAVFRMLQKHAAILDLFKNVTSGLATRQMIANYFECDEYLVGAAREDTANIGQTAVYGRIWGDYFGIAAVATSPGIRSASVGFTFRNGTKKTSQWYDPEPGVEGGYYAKVGVDESHQIVAPEAAYLIADTMA